MKKKIIGIIIILLVLIQFIQPEKNQSKDYTNDISTEINIPQNVQQIIKTSCADCHSNYTVYPWYNNIAPVSWFLANHVNEGKEHLNFSEWTTYNTRQKNHIIKELKEVIKEKEMPLTSYTLIHKDAILTEQQNTALLDWLNSIKKY
ncbi:MAG: heme-binding domain-containing protein [Lutibacter sp.]|uniref:heme-binding domain-containing protein n=1 Tax=Lutibacter sp. TaxID=1925666 RepID=UPI00299E414E|nr:heme-binding domain-containing protein [Lutibacter sp.]MDX1830223.1 heme-binding domain-containing protein [Lutibacter sp.]